MVLLITLAAISQIINWLFNLEQELSDTEERLHVGPACTTYQSIEHAGRKSLERSFPGYVNGSESALLPPVFLNKFPEVIQESKSGLYFCQKNEFTELIGSIFTIFAWL